MPILTDCATLSTPVGLLAPPIILSDNVQTPDRSKHEFHETRDSVTFHFMKNLA